MHIVVGLIIAFVLVAVFARRNRAARQCRWREDRTGDRGRLRKYRCSFCGAETFSPMEEGPPKVCKRGEQ